MLLKLDLLFRGYFKNEDTLEALKTANEILNMQSDSNLDEPGQHMAASLDLYEQAAENYIADPLGAEPKTLNS